MISIKNVALVATLFVLSVDTAIAQCVDPPDEIPRCLGPNYEGSFLNSDGISYYCRKYPVPPFEIYNKRRPKPEQVLECPVVNKPYAWIDYSGINAPPIGDMPSQRYIDEYPDLKQYIEEHPEQFKPDEPITLSESELALELMRTMKQLNVKALPSEKLVPRTEEDFQPKENLTRKPSNPYKNWPIQDQLPYYVRVAPPYEFYECNETISKYPAAIPKPEERMTCPPNQYPQKFLFKRRFRASTGATATTRLLNPGKLCRASRYERMAIGVE